MGAAIPIGLAVAGAGVKAAGTLMEASSQAKSLKSEAAQLEAQAGLDRASSQRSASEQRRQARLVASRGQAVAAASGAGADDPTVLTLQSDIAGEGEYRALSALYEGETAAQTKEAQAKANRKAAKNVKRAGYIGAASSLLDGGSSLFAKYGGK